MTFKTTVDRGSVSLQITGEKAGSEAFDVVQAFQCAAAMLRLPSFAFHGNYSAGQGNQTWLINLTLMIPPLQRREHMSGTFPGTAPIRIYITVQQGNYPHLTARKVGRKWWWNAQ